MADNINYFKRDELHEEWVGTEPQIPDSKISETITTDIAIVGAGLAGVAAAREACELGSKVLLIEKCKTPQARSGDFTVLDSKISKKWGRENIDKQQLVDDMMKDMGYRVNQAIFKEWADNAGESFDWYIEGYPEIKILNTTTEPVPTDALCWIQPRRYPEPNGYDMKNEHFKCYQTTVWIRPTHIRVFRGNLKLAEKTGNLELLCSTVAVKLLKENDNKVSGVIIKKENGEYARVLAKKGVILSTGDYSSNEQMLYHFCPNVIDAPRLWTSFDKDLKPSNVGEGHKMGVWAGAKMQDSPHAPMGHHMGGALGASGFLLLNKNGERFVNEDCPGQQINNQILIQPGKVVWQLADDNWDKYVPHITPNHGSVCYVLSDEKKNEMYDKLGTIDCFTSKEIVEKALADGSMIKADTIEELIEKMGLPKDVAIKSIARYNELCKSGEDKDFGKAAFRMFPVTKAPFYASKFTPATMIVCLGGLQSDKYCHTFNEKGEVLKGLYVAGNVQGDRFSGEYPLTVPGISHSMALTLGRLAGRNAHNKI